MDKIEETPVLKAFSNQDYYIAFKKSYSHREYKITQKKLSELLKVRQADVTQVFNFLDGQVIRNPTDLMLTTFLKGFRQHCTIDENGFLKIRAQENPDEFSPIIVHENFAKAQISTVVTASEHEISLINTYIATKLLDPEQEDNEGETLRNWLAFQDKKVRILLLRPDGKGMLLRSKTSLDNNGAELAEKILHQLKQLLELQTEFPNQLTVKLMDEIPGAAAIIFNNCAFYGLHLSFGHTEKGAWYEVKGANHATYKNLKTHFDTIWEDPVRSFPLTSDQLNHYKRALNIVRNELDFLSNSKWRVFLHEMTDVVHGKRPAPFEDSIGELCCWNMEISKPERGVYLQATLNIPGYPKPFPAKLITENLSDRDYAHARFTDFEQLSVHLSFHCRLENKDDRYLLGYFIVSAGGDSCSGYAVFEKIEVESKGEVPPLPPYLHRLLTFRDSSYFSLQRTRTDMDLFKEVPHAGIYRMYSYGGKKGGEKCIKLNWLSIDKFGVARYKNKKFSALTGRATLIDGNMHIVFTHFKHGERQRRSYMIISVHNEPQKNYTYYSGVHLGVSEDPAMPVGKRFILELVEDTSFDDLEQKLIPLHSKEYTEIHEPLRKLLSGRVKNLLGFLRKAGDIKDMIDIQREWEGSIHLSEVFFDSAVQSAIWEEPKTAAAMFLRAVNHGFDAIDRFETTVKAINPEMLQRIKACRDYKVVQSIFNIKPPDDGIEYHL